MATVATRGTAPDEPRPAFGEAERIAAEEIALELEAMGREAVVQPFWVRPYWWASQATCAGIGVLASVVAIRSPLTGLLIAFAALVLSLADETRLQPLRRLTPARGGQNVVSRPASDPPPGGIYLVVTAPIDDRRPSRSAGLTSSLILANVAALLLLIVCAGLRLGGFDGLLLDVAQLIPTLFLLALILAFLDRGTSAPVSDRSAQEATMELVARLDSRPPRHLAVAVVFAGAGDAHAAGLRHWLSARRKRGLSPRETAILAIEPCAEGMPVWWKRDGTVVATGLHPQLKGAAARASDHLPELGARAVSGPDATAAGVARGSRWPALAIAARTPESQGADDASEDGLREPSIAPLATAEFAEAVVRQLDLELSDRTDDGQSSSSS